MIKRRQLTWPQWEYDADNQVYKQLGAVRWKLWLAVDIAGVAGRMPVQVLSFWYMSACAEFCGAQCGDGSRPQHLGGMNIHLQSLVSHLPSVLSLDIYQDTVPGFEAIAMSLQVAQGVALSLHPTPGCSAERRDLECCDSCDTLIWQF